MYSAISTFQNTFGCHNIVLTLVTHSSYWLPLIPRIHITLSTCDIVIKQVTESIKAIYLGLEFYYKEHSQAKGWKVYDADPLWSLSKY